MSDFASLLQPDRGQPAQVIVPVSAAGLDALLAGAGEAVRQSLAAQRFAARPGQVATVAEGAGFRTFAGLPEARGPWDLAATAEALPAGTYRLEGSDVGPMALGWLLAQHRFDRYRREPEPARPRILLTTEAASIDGHVRLAAAIALVRDLVDTPAGDLGPAELAEAVEAIARRHAGATVAVTRGEALAAGYPMIAAVGRAASRARQPLLIELEWGDPAHPRIAIVGKGVCFDSGGLDIKPSAGMLLMKKDMGGAAHALALAGLVMDAALPVRLHLLIPAVENAIGGDAFRPGDILRSRAGRSVEIGNTDAEGRLVLADAITRALEEAPALLLDFATLTGAARVALGPDLPALFAGDDTLAADLLAAGEATGDPLWRLPLWAPYRDMLKSDLADINNAGQGGFAGAITAALFLKEFVTGNVPWAHVDTFAWMPGAKPGRPKGGAALGLAAAWHMLQSRFPRG
ncbi:MAG: leucyl aminopeptidase family protein [Sphingomonas fennica]